MEPADFEVLKSINLYEILGFITRDEFTPEIAKKKYRKLALKYHPDKNLDLPQDQITQITNKFETIQLAYLILSTPEYKIQYEALYDENLNAKDFKNLRESYKTEKEVIKFDKITEEEFKNKIHEINVKNNAVFDLSDVPDEQTATENLKKTLDERFQDCNDFLTQYKNDFDVLGNINDPVELNKKFNEMFESKSEQETHFDDMAAFGQSGLTVYNGNDALCNYTTLSNLDYGSMYSKNSTYEQSFKLNKVPKFVDDNKTLEERMAEYLNSTNNYASMALHSTAKNMSTADYTN